MTISFGHPKVIHCDGCGVEDPIVYDETGKFISLVNTTTTKDRWYCRLKPTATINRLGGDILTIDLCNHCYQSFKNDFLDKNREFANRQTEKCGRWMKQNNIGLPPNLKLEEFEPGKYRLVERGGGRNNKK